MDWVKMKNETARMRERERKMMTEYELNISENCDNCVRSSDVNIYNVRKLWKKINK